MNLLTNQLTNLLELRSEPIWLEGGLIWRDDPLFPIQELKTSITIDKEYWIILKAVADVHSSGKKLIQKYGIQGNMKKTWQVFQAYIHQAENYWYAATKMSPKTAGLLYYYCFLDLVKAFLLLKKHHLPNSYEIHGLSTKKTIWEGGLNNKRISVTPSQGRFSIFERYYQEVFGQQPPSQLSIWKLLSYTRDIGYQYQEVYKKESSSLPFIHRYAIDEKRKRCKIFLPVKQSVELALLKTDVLENWKSVFRTFFEWFERVDTPQYASQSFKDIFGFQSIEWIVYKFYRLKEDKEVSIVNDRFPINDLKNIIENAFGQWIEPDYDSSSFSGYINLPMGKGMREPMNQEIAIYSTMFFISELVRYKTDYLEKISGTNTGWLLESFVESCPLKFLRIITSRIMQEVIHISSF